MLAALCSMVLASACAGPGDPAEQVSVELFEPVVKLSETELRSGRVDVTVANVGEFPHTLVVTDETGQVVSASDLILPGEGVRTTLDLEAGEYRFTCRIVSELPDGSLLDHFEAGMDAGVVVRS